jgi:serine/threonine protein kinase
VVADQWTKVKSLVAQALSLSGVGRAQFISELRDAPSEIRDEVVRLLENDSVQSETSLAELGLAAETVRQLSVGDVLAEQYEIRGFLGAGGMGEVYEAIDSLTRESIAIKTLLPRFSAEPAYASRLRREVQLAQRVSHSNVCRVHQLNRGRSSTGSDLVFVTMELIRGETLSGMVRRGPLSLADSLVIAKQIASALDAAHAAGVLHRDLKSNNIMLTQADGNLQVRVMDFGLACYQDVHKAAESQLTSDDIVGTPEYMSPEQLQGLNLTPAADIYAFGVVIFEMITGQLPFVGHRALTVALKRLQQDAPDSRSLRANLPDHWNAAIGACLHRDPAHRPSSGSHVIELLEGLTTLPHPNRTRRWFLYSAAVSALLGTGGLALRLKPRSIDPEALLSFKRGEALANGRRSATELTEAIKEYSRATQLQPDYLDAWIGLANSYSAAANFGYVDSKIAKRTARDAADKAITLDNRSARAHGVLDYLISNDVHAWRSAGGHFRTAIQLDPRDAMVRLWYATFLGKLGRSSDAVVQLKAGLEADPTNMLLMHQLATEYLRERRFDLSYQQAVEMRRLHTMANASHFMVARAAEALGKFDEAKRSAADAVRFELPEHVAWSLLSIIALRSNELKEAKTLAGRVESVWRSKAMDVTHVVSPQVQLGLLDKSLKLLEEGLARDSDGVLSVHRNPWMDPIRSYQPYVDFCGRLGVDPRGSFQS